MEKTLFRLSDGEKANQISIALNPNFNEAGNWETSAVVLDVYDDYALIGDTATGGFKRAYYTKDGDNITLGDIVDVKIVDVTEVEYSALEAMKSAAGSYEAINTKLEESENKIADYEQIKTDFNAAQEKINSLESQINEYTSSLETKDAEITSMKEAASNFEAQIVRLNSEKDDLINEKESLVEFKANVEKQKKEEILGQFSEHLTDELLENFRNKINEYSVEDFKKEVCTAAYDNSTTLFSKNNDDIGLYPKVDNFERESLSPMEKLLELHKKKGGND